MRHLKPTLSLLSFPFVGICERLHESLVVMSMITIMNINDVIFNYKPIHNARGGSLEELSLLNDSMRFDLKSAGDISFLTCILFSNTYNLKRDCV